MHSLHSPNNNGRVTLRATQPGDAAAIVALNEEFVRFLSPMNAERYAELHALVAWNRAALVDGAFAGFLMVMREGVNYDSPNYRWFVERYDRFLYVDRLVVAASYRRFGIATQFYEELMTFALETQVPVVVAEFDLTPPNPDSARFHQRFGFREIGEQVLPSGKRVSLQVKQL